VPRTAASLATFAELAFLTSALVAAGRLTSFRPVTRVGFGS